MLDQIRRIFRNPQRFPLLTVGSYYHFPVMKSFRHSSTYLMQTAFLQENSLNISSQAFDEAKNTGFFEVLIPENLQGHLSELRAFSQEFYKNKQYDNTVCDQYRGYNLTFNEQYAFAAEAVEEGYMVDNHKGLGLTNENQVERFSLKKTLPNINHWQDFYPPKIRDAGEILNNIALLILVTAMKNVNIDPALWSAATGKAIVGKGAHYLLFNHYRSDIKTRGLKAHQDWSNVSLVLFTEHEKDRHALEAHIDGKWQHIVPTSDHHLIINFGLLLELLTQCLSEKDRIKGAVHRVIQQSYSRSSSVLFADHSFDAPIYQLSPDKEKLALIHKDFSEFVVDASRKTYEGDDMIWGESDSNTP